MVILRNSSSKEKMACDTRIMKQKAKEGGEGKNEKNIVAGKAEQQGPLRKGCVRWWDKHTLGGKEGCPGNSVEDSLREKEKRWEENDYSAR